MWPPHPGEILELVRGEDDLLSQALLQRLSHAVVHVLEVLPKRAVVVLHGLLVDDGARGESRAGGHDFRDRAAAVPVLLHAEPVGPALGESQVPVV